MYTFEDFEKGEIEISFEGVPSSEKEEFYKLLEEKGYIWSSKALPTQKQRNRVFNSKYGLMLNNDRGLPIVSYYDTDIYGLKDIASEWADMMDV